MALLIGFEDFVPYMNAIHTARSSTRSSSFRRDDSLVLVSRRSILLDTLRRLEGDDEELTAVQFCLFVSRAFRDSTVEPFVKVLRSSTHLKTVMFYVGEALDLSSESISVLADFIETSPTLEALGLEGDMSDSTTNRTDILLRAASRNPKLTQLTLCSGGTVKSSTLLEVMRDPSWRCLTIIAGSLDLDEDAAATREVLPGSYSLEALHIGEMCSNSLAAWLLAHIDPKSLKELTIALMMLPEKVVTTVSDVLVSAKDLRVFNLKVAFAADGPVSPILEADAEDIATCAQVTEIMNCLAQNKTIQSLSVFLPDSDNNHGDAELLETHICNNPNLFDVEGGLRCAGLASEKEKELKAICAKNERFLEVIGMDPPLYCPPELWPFLVERSLKTWAGYDAVFQRLRMHWFNDFEEV